MSWNIKTPGDYLNGPLIVADPSLYAPSLTWNQPAAAIIRSENGQVAVGSDNAAPYGLWMQVRNLSNQARDFLLNPLGGNVAIGGRSTNGKLHVQGTSVIGLFTQGPAPAAALSAVTIQAPVASGFSSSPVLNFWYQNTGISNPASECFAIRTNGADRVYVNSNGAVALSGGNTGANGVGVAFPAAQSASTDANTLDDYEEGTWSGNITGSTTNPTTAVTAIGRYTKIGRQVHLQIAFSDVNTTGASGTLLITGLPFANATGFAAQGSIASYSAITFTGSAACAVGSNESYMTILCSVSNAIWNVANHNAGTGRYLNATITYTVA
jgi:hypothetical protein